MPTVVVTGGLSRGYGEVGDGDPIVWVPGTGLSGHIWTRHQVPAFRDRYRCITVDLRGAGESDAPAEPPYTVALLRDDVAQLVEALGVDRAHFVGFSLGAAIVQELALSHPELVATATLLSAWSSSPREHHIRRHYESRLLALDRAPIEVFRAFSFWMWAPSFIDDEPERTAEIEQLLGEASAAMTPAAYVNHFLADLSHDARDRLPGIRCPTAVVYGAEDLITLPQYNRRVAAAVPGAELVEIAGAGHMACAERPGEVNEAIRAFLERHPLRTPMSTTPEE
jgi:3-oxoadipate enol-lactonase